MRVFSSLFSFGLLGRVARIAPALAASPRLTRLAFGSCLHQNNPQPIWSAVEKAKPEVFVFLGDNIYADTEDMAKMKHDYETQERQPGFARIRRKLKVIGTWDDHDFGCDDGGSDYPMKKQSKELMLDFFREPAGSIRRRREGVYTSYFYGEAPNRLQVILLDLRTFRSPLTRVGIWKRGYVPDPEGGGTLLGQEQWAWLEDQLREPADLRIIGSSIQFVSSEHKWEKWANFPRDKKRLELFLDRAGIRNALIISGDMHFSEFSTGKTPGGIELHDFTCSGLNVVEEVQGIPNSKRLFVKDNFAHFGFIQIDWQKDRVKARLESRDLENIPVFRKDLIFSRD